MSIRELLEEGDTGEALLPAKVNDQGVHADRDGSEPRGLVDVVRSLSADHEAPRADNPLHGSARTRGAETSITDLWISAAKRWRARAESAEAKVARVEDLAAWWDVDADENEETHPTAARTMRSAVRDVRAALRGES